MPSPDEHRPTNHGQIALSEQIVKAIDAAVAEWNLTSVEIVGTLHVLATLITTTPTKKGGEEQ